MLVRRGVEFRLEDAHTLLVLAQGKHSPVTSRIEQHQLAVGGLVERVERQPVTGVLDGDVPGVLGRTGVGEHGQHCACFLAQVLALREQPHIKLRAVTRRQMGQQIIPV